VVGVILFSSQAPTPPVATPPVTTPVKTPVSAPVKPPTTPVSFPTVPTQGGVSSGAVTNISGGPASSSGIGTSAGTGGRCSNTGGASSSCTPRAGERAVVIACPSRTGIECAGPQGGSVVADNITGTASISSYLGSGCTIQIDIFTIGSAITDTSALRDFLVFQKDSCGETTPPVTPPPTPICGTNCTTDANCQTGDVCSATGKCVLAACKTNPSLCIASLCALSTAPKQCGGSCTTSADCTTGNTCGSNGLCTATVCTDANSGVTCSGGCPVTTTGKCGDSCANDTACPNNHTCSQGKCVADFCLPNKCNDGCQLPATALISDEADRLLHGLVALILGFLALRTNFHSKLFFTLGGRYLTAGLFESEAEKLAQEEAEDQVQQRKQKIRSAQKIRDNFEKSILDPERP